MDVEKFGAPLGATVRGVDVRSADEETVREINQLFLEHQVLHFPEQSLSPEDQMAFARNWGELIAHPYAGMSDYPDIIELKNAGKRRDVNQHWHSDMTYNELPPKFTMLYALETPPIGGDTAFANQYLAYEELSDGLRSVLDQLDASHTAANLATTVYREDAAEAPHAVHPLVRTHDETGRKALYVCRAFTDRIVGWSRRESRALLEFLFEHSVRPEYQARHRWRPADLVMWDNRCVLHYAVHDHGDDPRRIHRLQVVGPRPA